MRRLVTVSSLALALALLLAACGSPQEGAGAGDAATSETPPPPPTTKVVGVAAGGNPASWAQCQSCHSAEAGKPNGVGPNLHGLVGGKAGTAPGFAYSPAMKHSGLTWDAATLDKYLENPRALVPATKMAYPGLRDAAARQALIAWLAEQK